MQIHEMRGWNLVRHLLVVATALSMAVVIAGYGRLASAQEPGLTVTSPAEAATITGQDVTVQFDLTDFAVVPSTVPLDQAGMRPEVNRPGEGHLHFMLDLEPIVVWDRNEPYTFTDVPTGEHVLTVELANNDHAPLSPAVVQQIRFRTVAGAVLPNTGSGGNAGSSSGATLLVLGGIAIGLIVAGQLVGRRGGLRR